jgi:hypothetical protein
LTQIFDTGTRRQRGVLDGAEQRVVVDLLGIAARTTWSPTMIVGIGLPVRPAFSSK